MPGRLVLVVGPSGAGKDSLINAARLEFSNEPDFVFPRRVITRQAVHTSEDHDALSPEDFAVAVARGEFFLEWRAHGLQYGLPQSISAALRENKIVIVNVSRTIIAKAAELWPETHVILVTARPEILAARVAARQRSEDGDIQKRISRAVDLLPQSLPTTTIHNDGALATAVEKFCAALKRIRAN